MKKEIRMAKIEVQGSDGNWIEIGGMVNGSVEIDTGEKVIKFKVKGEGDDIFIATLLKPAEHTYKITGTVFPLYYDKRVADQFFKNGDWIKVE